MSSGKNCLVTGCAGFIGSHLSAALLDQGHTVIGIDNFFSGYPHNMEKFINNPDFYFMDMSIVEDEFWDEIIEKFSSVDVVFHLAAIVSVPYSLKHAETTMETNYASSVKMIEGARSHGVESFIFAGSAAEYGAEVRLPVREEYAREVDDHLSPYGLAKFRTSIYLEDSGYGCSLRFFNVFGPRQDPSSAYSGVISRFIDFGLSERSMVIFGDGLQSRDFIHVSDAVKVYLLAAGLDSSGKGPLKGIYNVGTGKGTSVLELAERVLELTGSDKDITFKPERAGDIKHSIADISKLEAVGFKPEISLEDGLEDTIKWEKVVRRIS